MWEIVSSGILRHGWPTPKYSWKRGEVEVSYVYYKLLVATHLFYHLK